MTKAKELREYCEKLRVEREENLKTVLNDYFEAVFIKSHKPWRAVIGNKKCKPIPIYRDFYYFENNSTYPEKTEFGWRFKWPNMSEEMIRQGLMNLGFVITENWISISVPAYEKGKKLTFAQEWVKKINTSYSEYCANEKKRADRLYEECISDLMSMPTEFIRTFDEYTLFCEFMFSKEISITCAKFFNRLMVHDGIEEHYENGVYKGIKVSRQTAN